MPETNRPQIVLVNRCLITNDADELLLLQRAQLDSHNPGLWEFPGGKLDAGQDLSHALKREVMEETGLLVEPSSRLVYADSFIIGNGKYKGLTYVALFGIASVIGGTLKLSDEHDSYVWANYGHAQEYNLTAECRKALIVLGQTALRNHG